MPAGVRECSRSLRAMLLHARSLLGRPVLLRQHTSAHVSTRQHTSAHVSIRQHTSAQVSMFALCMLVLYYFNTRIGIRMRRSGRQHAGGWECGRAEEYAAEYMRRI